MHNPLFAARQPIFAAACMAACMASSPAFADCTLRATRPAETAFNSRAMAALVAALPPVPAGVVEVGAKPYDFKNAPAIDEVLCEGTKEGEFSVTARRQYIRKHSEAERRQLQAQYDALTAQFHAFKPQTRELDQRRIAIDLVSQKVDIVIGMNLQRLPMANDRTVVGSHGTASPGKGVGLKVHNVAWSAVGSDGPLRQALAAAIDRARLQALVGKPLPSEAESEAVAAKVTLAVVTEMLAGAPASAAPTIEPTSSTTANAAPGTARTTAVARGTAASATAPAPAAPPAAEPVKKAAETVNLLRGLLGR